MAMILPNIGVLCSRKSSTFAVWATLRSPQRSMRIYTVDGGFRCTGTDVAGSVARESGSALDPRRWFWNWILDRLLEIKRGTEDYGGGSDPKSVATLRWSIRSLHLNGGTFAIRLT
jgi:hypothetical protein